MRADWWRSRGAPGRTRATRTESRSIPGPPRAASWSLLGAIVAALENQAVEDGELPLDELAAALYALAELIETDSLVDWNDDPRQTQDNVLDVLDRAAAVYESHSLVLLSSN